MKRIVSILMLLAMLASLFVLSPAALATGDTPAETEKPVETEKPAETPAPTAAPEPTATPAPTAAPEPTATPAPTPEPQVLTKITVRLDRTPVVMMPVSEPKSAVSSKNASLVSLSWYDLLGNKLPGNSAFDYTTYRMEIIARADDGYIFSSGLNAYLNNSATSCSVSADGKYVTLIRQYEALVYPPRIIKHPGEETIKEGGFVSYVSTAVYAKGLTWEFVSPDGQTVFDSKDVSKTFPNSRCENDGKEKIIIYNVPLDMNGWKVRAVFSGVEGTVTRSNPVTIKVEADPNHTPEPTAKPEETPEPTEEPAETAKPTPTPASTPTPVPSEKPVETAAPDQDHEHLFAAVWTADETKHWHECSCGERSEEAAHSMRWKTLSVDNGIANQEGVCTVCGYREAKQVTVNEGRIINKVPMSAVIGGSLGLMAVLVIAESVKRSKRR